MNDQTLIIVISIAVIGACGYLLRCKPTFFWSLPFFGKNLWLILEEKDKEKEEEGKKDKKNTFYYCGTSVTKSEDKVRLSIPRRLDRVDVVIVNESNEVLLNELLDIKVKTTHVLEIKSPGEKQKNN